MVKIFVDQTGQKAEWKDLAGVSMAGELQVNSQLLSHGVFGIRNPVS